MICRRHSNAPQTRGGFALIIVMIIIFSLAVLAGGFAFSMKVEARLAANNNSEGEIQWLGRSGVELARFVLSESFRQPKPAALNQIWAGGPGDLTETNGPLLAINLASVKLGDGVIAIHIEDQERRANINRVDRQTFERALAIIGLNTVNTPVLLDSLEDWLDRDDNLHLSGTESDYYLNQDPPYYAKNGPIDDITELLLVNGITPELFWGPRVMAHRDQLYRPYSREEMLAETSAMGRVGLVDLFTALSFGSININTAPVEVLQLLPGVDEVVAENIIRTRAGLDGMEGTEDDTPFQNISMLSPATVPGITPEAVAAIQQLRLADVRSLTFKVTVEATLGRQRREYRAVVGVRGSVVEILEFSWP
jgi:general secretion pathway protein K